MSRIIQFCRRIPIPSQGTFWRWFSSSHWWDMASFPEGNLNFDEPLDHLTTNSLENPPEFLFKLRDLAPEELLDFLRKEGPFDVVVADFATSSGFQVAEELKIPCILNVPGEGPKGKGGEKRESSVVWKRGWEQLSTEEKFVFTSFRVI